MGEEINACELMVGRSERAIPLGRPGRNWKKNYIEIHLEDSGRELNAFELRLSLPDGLCGLVVSVPGYRSRGPGSIPGATRFSEK
jgi:hypothetical protein